MKTVISHTRTSNLPPEEQFEDSKLEEKRTRAYSRVVGYVKKIWSRRSNMGWEVMSKDIRVCGDGCVICEKPVVEREKFYYRGKWEVVHAVCLWDEEEVQLNKEEG